MAKNRRIIRGEKVNGRRRNLHDRTAIAVGSAGEMTSDYRLNNHVPWTPVILLVCIALPLVLRGPSTAAELANPSTQDNDHPTINFSGYTGGPVEKWLEAQGFKLERDATKRNLLGLSINQAVLTVEAKARMSGFLLNDSVKLDHAGTVKITWGVSQYPQNASYAKQVNNEALMLYIFFGAKKLSSGNLLIPSSPYFIGLFLCQNDQVNVPYKGRYFHAGGRFVCLGQPPTAEMIVSELDLERAFKSYFGKNEVPPITGIGFGIDTSKAGNGGKSAAFIKSIEFRE